METASRRQLFDADGRLTLVLRENGVYQTHAVSAAQAQHLSRVARKYLKVTPSWSGGVELTAHQFVGILAFEDLTIRIEPKVPVDNLFYMLSYAYDLPQFRRETAPMAQAENIFDFIVDIFTRQVQHIVRQGIYRRYVNYVGAEPFLKGRLAMTRQLRRQPAVADRFHQELSVYTANVLENQILKLTLWRLSRVPTLDSARRQVLRRTLSAFSDVALQPLRAVDCDRVVFQRLNANYRPSIHLAQLLLQNLAVEGGAGTTPFATFMLPMYQVFELFVARYLVSRLTDDATHDVEIQPDIWLGEQRLDKRTPDIVLRHVGRPCLIIDTKYKEFAGKPTPDDLNQMFVYCHTMRVEHGLLLYADPTQINFADRYHQATIQAGSLPLGKPLALFEQACEQMVRAILQRYKSVEG